jgi:hypothetical protein
MKMRPKEIFSKLNQSEGRFDVEKIKQSNPGLWKKMKMQFDTGRQIVAVQLGNGIDNLNEKTKREKENEAQMSELVKRRKRFQKTP